MTEQSSVMGYRLSPQQRQAWRAREGAGASQPAFDAQCRVVIEGELNAGDVKAAVAEVVGRHEILRTRFVTRAGMKTPVQVVAAGADPDWREEDLSDAGPEHQTRRVEELALEETRRGFADDRASMLRVALLTLSARRHML